jgi:hypothetical protein
MSILYFTDYDVRCFKHYLTFFKVEGISLINKHVQESEVTTQPPSEEITRNNKHALPLQPNKDKMRSTVYGK